MLVSSQTDRTNPIVMKGGLFVLWRVGDNHVVIVIVSDQTSQQWYDTSKVWQIRWDSIYSKDSK